ncbi:hypothetical protein HPB49_010470 [Dermacentor silvarum]|uniref:Uncharacterized protein n=1 Tax=Dermacentor silvarum TaxID=543639 RepID=A0ACB8C8T7_DERSI|nr:hypothetical protein HPB49_010470 [Dermacentor silvarum]
MKARFAAVCTLPASNSVESVADTEFTRWMVATAIALVLLALITGLAFFIDSMFRHTGSDRYQTEAPFPFPAKHLLSSVACNSTLCRRYSELIASCAGHGGGSPCEGLSHFVCGEGVCYGRPFEELLRGYLRALAADALASWKGTQLTSHWPAVDRAADLYKECREIAENDDGESATSVLESVSASELSSLVGTNETAGELATRLAALYQDGGFFWLDTAAVRRGELKWRLLVRANGLFERHAEHRDSSAGHRRRRSAASADGATDSLGATDIVSDDTAAILSGMDNVHLLWKQAGNLLAYNPEVLTVAELDQYGLSSAILIAELNRDGGAAVTSNATVEVHNSALLRFLIKALALKNVKAYLAWEFLRHRRACFASSRLQERTLADSCFDCVERVAGLAAHAPFLRTSSEAESQAKVSAFLTHLKSFVASAVGEAKWLSPTEQVLMNDRLFKFDFTRGVPARKNGVALLNKHYAYLPTITGDFARDFDAAAHAAWNASLGRSSVSMFPMLSAFPNVLTGNDRAYIPAVMLVSPLFSYRDAQHPNFGFLGVALMRSLAHNLALTGLQQLSDPENAHPMAEHLDRLGGCLRLNRSSRQAYASRMADVLALDAAVRAFLEGYMQRPREKAEAHKVFLDACMLTCTDKDPHRCDAPARQADTFEAAFSCPHLSAMTKATKCPLW